MKREKTCNKELLRDTQLATKESAATILGAVGFLSKFIADTIEAGAYETVMVPYFGKFQPKTKEIQWRAHRKGMQQNTAEHGTDTSTDTTG